MIPRTITPATTHACNAADTNSGPRKSSRLVRFAVAVATVIVYCAPALSVSGCVTTLMFVIPDCRSASTTVAQLPNGTVASARR